MLKCDFCSSHPITAIYNAADFIFSVFSIGGLDQESKGAWAACKDCETFIDAQDWEGLIKRVTDQFIQTYPVMSWVRPEIERDFGCRLHVVARTSNFTKQPVAS